MVSTGPIGVAHHFGRAPSRTGFRVTAAGRPAGVVVHDERPSLSGAACRCGAALYDRPLSVAACWLAGHLADVHGVDRLAVDLPGAGRGPGGARVAVQLAGWLTVAGRRAVA